MRSHLQGWALGERNVTRLGYMKSLISLYRDGRAKLELRRNDPGEVLPMGSLRSAAVRGARGGDCVHGPPSGLTSSRAILGRRGSEHAFRCTDIPLRNRSGTSTKASGEAAKERA